MSTLNYHLVQDSDIDECDKSSTEEYGNLLRTNSSPHLWPRTPTTILWIVLGFAILNALGNFIVYYETRRYIPGILSEDMSPKSDISSKADITRQFQSNFDYMSLDHQYDHLWHDAVGYPGGINSSQGIESGEKRYGLLTMFHQLHCLEGMRKAIQMAREGQDPGVNQHDDHHWPHCFDYLRQTILCHADDVVERIDPIQKIVTGTQDLRKCNDAQKLYDAQDIWNRITLEAQRKARIAANVNG